MESTQERPPIADSPISAVIPTAAAGEPLAKTVHGLVAYLKTLKRPFEVIVSRETSVGDLGKVGDIDTNVRGLPGEGVNGYGAALRAGLAAAKYPLVATLPDEGGYRPEELARLLAQIDHADVVAGYRKPPIRASWRRRVLARLLFGLRFRDLGCRFRLYRRSIFERIPIQSRGGFADTEILAKANFLGCLFLEEEVFWSGLGKAGRSEPWRAADFMRVFRSPDFGPAKLDETPASSE